MVGTGGAPHATQWAPAIMDREAPHLARHPASSTTSQRWSSTLAEALPMEQIREASSHTHTPTRANPRGAHPGAHPCSTQVCHMPSDTSAHVWHSKMAPRDERDKGNEVWGAGHGVQGHCHGVVCKGCGSGLVCCLLIQLSYYTSMMVLHIDQDLFRRRHPNSRTGGEEKSTTGEPQQKFICQGISGIYFSSSIRDLVGHGAPRDHDLHARHDAHTSIPTHCWRQFQAQGSKHWHR